MKDAKPYRRGAAAGTPVNRPADNPASQPLPAGPLLGKGNSSWGGGGCSVSQDVGQPYRSQRKQPKAGNSY